MKNVLKTAPIGNVVISETTGKDTVTLSINGETASLTRDDFSRLYKTGQEFLAKDISLKCSACGGKLEGEVDLLENIAILTVEPCHTCSGKE